MQVAYLYLEKNLFNGQLLYFFKLNTLFSHLKFFFLLQIPISILADLHGMVHY